VPLGNGSVVTGTFSGIDWSSNSHYIEVEMDPAGGNSYQVMGVSQLLSVPYALYAESSGTDGATGPLGPARPLVSGTAGQTLRNSGSTWAATNAVYVESFGNVGIGTTSPTERLDVNGDIAISGSSRSIMANNGAFNISSSTGIDLIIDNDDNSTSSIFRIKKNGDGSEVLMQVSEDGNVTIGGNVTIDGENAYENAKTHYLSFHPTDFKVLTPGTVIFAPSFVNSPYGEFLTGNIIGLGYANALVKLPDGAKVTEVRAWVWGNSSTTPVRVQLYEHSLATGALTFFNIGAESDVLTAMASIQEVFQVKNRIIDNSTTSYILQFTGRQNSNDTRLCGARITYTVDQAD